MGIEGRLRDRKENMLFRGLEGEVVKLALSNPGSFSGGRRNAGFSTSGLSSAPPFPLPFILTDMRLPKDRTLERPFLMDSDIEGCLRTCCLTGRELEGSGAQAVLWKGSV